MSSILPPRSPVSLASEKVGLKATLSYSNLANLSSPPPRLDCASKFFLEKRSSVPDPRSPILSSTPVPDPRSPVQSSMSMAGDPRLQRSPIMSPSASPLSDPRSLSLSTDSRVPSPCFSTGRSSPTMASEWEVIDTSTREEIRRAFDLVIHSVRDKFFTGCGRVLIGSYLRVIPQGTHWEIQNAAIGLDFKPIRELTEENFLEYLCIKPTIYSAALPIRETRDMLRSKSISTFSTSDEKIEMYALADGTLHVLSHSDKALIKLPFANSLTLFTKDLRKGYSIFNALVTKEPHIKNGYIRDSLESLQFLAFKALGLFSEEVYATPKSTVFLSGVLRIKKSYSELWAENITTKLKGPLLLDEQSKATHNMLPLEPADILRIDPESHSLDIPSLASLQARIAACQERGEKAYTFTDYLGITYFSWPDNTIQVICSEFTYKPCYRKLTFADGASFYTRNVHRGSSTYRVSNVEVSIADPDSADRYQKASAGPRKSI